MIDYFTQNIKNFIVIQITERSTVYKDKSKDIYIKKHLNPKSYKNELYWNQTLKNTNILPKLTYHNDEHYLLIFENCGNHLKINQIDKNISEQLKNILDVLAENKCVHNDISKIKHKYFTNILIDSSNIVRLIDFEWASIKGTKSMKPIKYYDCDILKYNKSF